MNFIPEGFLFGLSVMIIGPPPLQPPGFPQAMGVVVAQHDVIKDLAHDRAYCRACTAVFKDDRDGNLGIVIRRKGGH